MIYDFVVFGQKLTLANDPYVVSDTIDFLTAHFRFSGEWDGLEKHAIFDNGNDTYDVTLTDDEILESDHLNLTSGTWQISVAGVEYTDAVVTQRITTQPVDLTIVASGSTSGEPFPPASGSTIYVNVNQATPQAFVGGIPLLAPDRTITSDREIVDKEYVDDSITALNVSGTNTGDQAAVDFNHNDLANKQGGSAGEYYHTTQAQNAALHAHSNKTALDAVSGTNTGDQDVSGAISTHNTDAGAHANLARKSETMRLLISRTIQAGENVSAITWTQDDAGNSLSLLEVRIVTRVPANSIAVGTSGNISLRINDRAGASDYQRASVLVSSVFMTLFRTDKGYGDLNLIKVNGYLSGVMSFTYSDGTALAGSIYQYNTNFTVNTITKLHAFVFGLTYFPAGTTIDIYGRTE